HLRLAGGSTTDAGERGKPECARFAAERHCYSRTIYRSAIEAGLRLVAQTATELKARRTGAPARSGRDDVLARAARVVQRADDARRRPRVLKNRRTGNLNA